MPYYELTIFGWNFEIQAADIAAFQIEVKKMIEDYMFTLKIDGVPFKNNQKIKDAIKEILGIA